MSTGYLAIVNPAAGGGTGKRTAATAIGALRDAGISVDVVETQAAGDGTRIASEAYGEGRRDFISVGGDGTSYEVINGLMPACANTDERPSLAIVPAGTGNSFLRDFTEDGVQTAIDALLHDRVRDCDIVRVEHTKGTVFSINLFSLGFVAQVGALTNRRFKRFGEMGYVLGVLTMLAKLKPVSLPMRVNGGALRDDAVTFLSINNSQFTGGKMWIAPGADPTDGHADLLTVGPLGRAALLATFPKIFKGTHVEHRAVSMEAVETILFELQEEVDVLIDGEVLSLHPKKLQILKGALRLRV